MKSTKHILGAGLLGISLLLVTGEAPAQSLGDLLNGALKAINNVKQKASGQPAAPVERVAVTAVTFDDLSVLANGQVPALSPDQFTSMQKLSHEHLGYEDVQALFGTPRAQLPAEFNERFAKTNFKDGFARQDFVTWAQPYVNWSENYLMRTQIFVCPGCDAVAANIYHYDFKAAGFHVVVSLNDSKKEVETLAKFPEDVTRKIESLIANQDVVALAYLSLNRLPPNDITPLAVQVFQRSTGQSLGLTQLPAATPEQFTFIQAHAISDPVNATQVAVGQAGSSLADALQAEAAVRQAAAPAPAATSTNNKQYSFAAIKAQVRKLGSQCAKTALVIADSATAMTDPFPDMKGIYVFLAVQNSGEDPFVLGPLSATPTAAELSSLKGSKLCPDAASS
jgi:hypothetical protein